MPEAEPASRLEAIAEMVRAATGLAPPAAGDGGVFVPNQVERVTYHDFALYQTVFDPWATRDPRPVDNPDKPSTLPTEAAPPPPEYLPSDLLDFTDLSFRAQAAIANFLDDVRLALAEGVTFDAKPAIRLIYRFRTECYDELIRHYQSTQIPFRLESMLVFFVEEFLAGLMETFPRMNVAQQQAFYAQYFDRAVHDWVIRTRNMELPWLVPGNGTMQQWTDAGYVVSDTFRLVPKALATATNTQGIYPITGWVGVPDPNAFLGPAPNPPPPPLAHEYAWVYDRTAGSRGSFHGGLYDRASLYFAPGQRLVEGSLVNDLSDVLVGAVDILAAPAPTTPSELDQLSAAARALVEQYGTVLGAAPTTATPRTARDVYGFEPYPTGSINLGMRVLYRQAWHPRGIQPGELVRTIPLAPGQKERFSTKIIRRNKLTREIEDTRSTETTQESVVQTKDSSEIVEEAAASNKWHVDATASGSFNMGFFGVSASTSTGYAQENSKSSRDTKSRLAESMQKTARTSRRENRVKVSTEREETFESERATEITNPNQEIAITCFYETVQQIYTVNTALEGIDPVIFVAERVPRPEELTIDWIRRYDWILDRVLLDDSFRDTLGLVSTQQPDFALALSAQSLGLDEVSRLSKVLEKAEASLATIHQLPGSIANTYEATLNAYQSAVAMARSRLEQVQQLLLRVERLVDHVADNILYYCRAIWAEEDTDRRMMRYASLRLPTRFRPSLNTVNVETDPLTGQAIYTGAWEADPNSWRPLSDVIHPVGPIAYAGNYAVYRIRYIESTAGLSRVIRLANQAYYEPVPPLLQVSAAGRAAALNATVIVDNEDFYSGDNYVLRVSNPPVPPPPPAGGGPLAGGGVVGPAVQFGLQLTLIRREFDGTAVDLTALAAPNQGAVPAHMIGPLVLSFDGLRLTVAGQVQAGDEIVLLARPPLLVDPELKYRRLLDPLLTIAEAQQQIDDDNTEDIVVDTSNLWLNLIKGSGTVLEDFKLEHRRIDVETARAELIRRYLRLDQNVLADPDIEKKVIIHGPANATRVAEGEAVLEDPPPAPAPPIPPGG